MIDEPDRVYIKGTMRIPKPRRWHTNKPIYRHFKKGETLYYQNDGKYYCSVDDKKARGFVLNTPDGEKFLPHDYDDLLFYEGASRLAKQAGIYFPKPSHPEKGHRTPPPLFVIREARRERFVWNRNAILRHIDETLRRKHA